MKLRLVGIMTYYGKHYTTFVYNSKQETWFYLDDAEVKEVRIFYRYNIEKYANRCFFMYTSHHYE